jgi:hypothetical protein
MPETKSTNREMRADPRDDAHPCALRKAIPLLSVVVQFQEHVTLKRFYSRSVRWRIRTFRHDVTLTDSYRLKLKHYPAFGSDSICIALVFKLSLGTRIMTMTSPTHRSLSCFRLSMYCCTIVAEVTASFPPPHSYRRVVLRFNENVPIDCRHADPAHEGPE